MCCLSPSGAVKTVKTAHAQLGRNKLTIHEFSDGLRQRLNTAGEIPGILLDVEAQPFGAVHLRLHLLLKLCGKNKHAKNLYKKKKAFRY